MGIVISLLILLAVSTMMMDDRMRQPGIRRYYNWGIASRIFGTLAYLYYAFNITGGNVDAFVYDNWALEFSEYFLQGDFSPITDPSLYRGGQFFYTNFVAYPAALFLIITFNSTFGIYLLFSTACFAGLVLMLKSFFDNYPLLDRQRVILYVLLFPAVWFWTSTIGKDGFVFLGVGVMCTSFSPRGINYLKFAFGLAIVYAFRPPVAYMGVLAFAALFILNLNDSLMVKLVKVAIGIFLTITLLEYLGSEWRIESFDIETIAEFQQNTLRNNAYGTGALEEKSGGIASIPQGVIDVLARPFIWESRDITTFLASLEISFMLLILWFNRKSVGSFLRSMLVNRLSTFIGAFVVIYVISTGLFENNIGLIARHRSILFPFLFLAAFGFAGQSREQHLQRRSVKPTLKPV